MLLLLYFCDEGGGDDDDDDTLTLIIWFSYANFGRSFVRSVFHESSNKHFMLSCGLLFNLILSVFVYNLEKYICLYQKL